MIILTCSIINNDLINKPPGSILAMILSYREVLAMLKTMILVLAAIAYMGLCAANEKETEWLSWFLALIVLGVLNVFYSVFLKYWPCCCFAYQPEFPQKTDQQYTHR